MTLTRTQVDAEGVWTVLMASKDTIRPAFCLMIFLNHTRYIFEEVKHLADWQLMRKWPGPSGKSKAICRGFMPNHVQPDQIHSNPKKNRQKFGTNGYIVTYCNGRRSTSVAWNDIHHRWRHSHQGSMTNMASHIVITGDLACPFRVFWLWWSGLWRAIEERYGVDWKHAYCFRILAGGFLEAILVRAERTWGPFLLRALRHEAIVGSFTGHASLIGCFKSSDRRGRRLYSKVFRLSCEMSFSVCVRSMLSALGWCKASQRLGAILVRNGVEFEMLGYLLDGSF